MRGPRFWVVVVLLAAGSLAGYSLQHGERIAPHQPLSTLPMQFGSWNGMDLELSQSIAEATGADEILNRAYLGSDGEL